MASLTDRQLIEQIQLGQSEALGQLFDRYGGGIFDFLSRVAGDPDEAIHLVVDVFVRFVQTTATVPEHGSVRGALFALAYETTLSHLRQSGGLDSLPRVAPINVSSSDLANDIWQAASEMPAAQRAVLAVSEHHALSPMEQATALGVMRHALPEIVAQARRSFGERFDLLAQAKGKPVSALVNADHVPGLQRRVPDPEASLFTFLPLLVLSDAAHAQARNQIVVTTSQPPPVVTPTPPRAQALPAFPIEQDIDSGGTRNMAPILIGLGVVVLLLAGILAGLAFRGISQATPGDTTPPIIKQMVPPNGAILPSGKGIVVQADYSDDRAVDVKSVRLILDAHDVTAQTTVSAASISYVVDLAPGRHFAVVELQDTSRNPSSQTWEFTVSGPTPTSTPIPTATNVPTVTPLPTATNVPTATPLPTATRLPTATPLPSATPIPAPALPDLVVTDISLSPNAEILYTIRNDGRGDVTKPFLIRVLVDGGGVDSNRKVSSLGAGQEASLFVPNYRLSGTHAVTVNMNADHAIQESNYANGELTRTLSGPILTPTPSPTPSPSPTPK